MALKFMKGKIFYYVIIMYIGVHSFSPSPLLNLQTVQVYGPSPPFE